MKNVSSTKIRNRIAVKRAGKKTCLLFAFLLTGSIMGTAEVINEVSGISADDIKIASVKTELTLFDVYALAVHNSQQLPAAREILLQARSRKHQAIGSVLPRISIKGNVIFLEPDNQSSSTQQTSISLYARQPIITGLDEITAFKNARYESAIARYELANSAGALLDSTAYCFFHILQLEKSLKNSNEIRDLYLKTMQELNRRVLVGKSRRSDLLRTSEKIYRIEATIRALESELMRCRLELHALAGIPVDAVLIEGSDLHDPAEIPDPINPLVENRWDIKAEIERVKLAQANIWASAGGQFPSVYLEGAYRLYQESPNSGSEYYGALGFEIPLLAGEVPGRVEERFSIKRQAELNLAAKRKDAEREIRDSFQAWKGSLAETESYRKALDASERNHEVIMNEYRLNLVTILDVLTTLESLQNARNDYARIVLQHRLDRIRCGIAVNELSGRGISILKNSEESK
ncbi:MAG: hypothetical protein CVV44_22715 [Spirochaetae bacterium HGW-Spirochaetae-1]|jgi:outer membrane protein TolC|nr:MAG: hypothetical protein CVV44_22715 [Spirochaetae bacterium HGW-Spirochaetae-1]